MRPAVANRIPSTHWPKHQCKVFALKESLSFVQIQTQTKMKVVSFNIFVIWIFFFCFLFSSFDIAQSICIDFDNILWFSAFSLFSEFSVVSWSPATPLPQNWTKSSPSLSSDRPARTTPMAVTRTGRFSERPDLSFYMVHLIRCDAWQFRGRRWHQDGGKWQPETSRT